MSVMEMEMLEAPRYDATLYRVVLGALWQSLQTTSPIITFY